MLALVLVSCTPQPSTPPPQPPTTSASGAVDGRPLLPVPQVRPSGFAKPPPGSGLARYLEQTLRWTACGSTLQCATVLAPLDYAQPDGTAVTLFLAKLPASAPTKLGTLFVNPGGPGGSGADFVGGLHGAGLDAYDLIGWDPRGVGRSTPVRCFGSADLDRYNAIDLSPDDAAEERILVEADRTFAESCLQRSGALLEHISTAETVRDLDLLCRLVGSPRLNYLGFSYGTSIGSVYAQTYPARVGRMVLDGAVDPSDGGSVPQVLGFERALDHFAASCAQQRCGLGRSKSQVLTKIADLLRRLDQQPMVIGRRMLSQQQAVAAVFQALYAGRAGWVGLDSALEAAVHGDGAALLKGADDADRRDRDGHYGQLQYAFPAIRCRDSQIVSVAEAERQFAADRAAAPLLAPLSGPDLVCTQWPVAPAPKPARLEAKGAPPIVVVGTTGDPATPYEWAQLMAKDLDSGVLVTYRGEGHTAYGQSGCVHRLVNAFLISGAVPKKGATC